MIAFTLLIGITALLLDRVLLGWLCAILGWILFLASM